MCYTKKNGRILAKDLPQQQKDSERMKNMSDLICYPTIDTFDQEVIHSSIPVVVDFYADWCGPCQSLAPVLEKLAKDYEGKLKFCKVNVDNAQQLAIAHRVMSIPTLLLYQGGNEIDRIIGAYPQEVMEQKLAVLL